MPDPTTRAPDANDVNDEAVKAIVRTGPIGTWAVAGVATVIVMAIYLLFYFLVYVPRGAVQ